MHYSYFVGLYAYTTKFFIHCRILGFYNTPFVTGRRLDLLNEVLPVATTAVAKHITVKAGQIYRPSLSVNSFSIVDCKRTVTAYEI